MSLIAAVRLADTITLCHRSSLAAVNCTEGIPTATRFRRSRTSLLTAMRNGACSYGRITCGRGITAGNVRWRDRLAASTLADQSRGRSPIFVSPTHYHGLG